MGLLTCLSGSVRAIYHDQIAFIAYLYWYEILILNGCTYQRWKSHWSELGMFKAGLKGMSDLCKMFSQQKAFLLKWISKWKKFLLNSSCCLVQSQHVLDTFCVLFKVVMTSQAMPLQIQNSAKVTIPSIYEKQTNQILKSLPEISPIPNGLITLRGHNWVHFAHRP